MWSTIGSGSPEVVTILCRTGRLTLDVFSFQTEYLYKVVTYESLNLASSQPLCFPVITESLLTITDATTTSFVL